MSEQSAEIRAQTEAILDYLLSGRSLTPQDALSKFSCFRLSARIYDLRKRGYGIATISETNGNRRWARYALVEQHQGAKS